MDKWESEATHLEGSHKWRPLKSMGMEYGGDKDVGGKEWGMLMWADWSESGISQRNRGGY